jgi:NRPS condensation-like uncharacterized protein
MKEYEISDKYGSWFRLDNSAAVYPMLITLKTQSLFRLGVELTSYIDRDDLEKALKLTFKRFPSFEVDLSQVFFRHYFTANHRPPIIRADDGSLLKRIDFRFNNGYLLRVTYYKNKIFTDFFHGLCDGAAAVEFVKSLVYHYLTERGEEIPDEGKVKTIDSPIDTEEFIDGFKKYYTKFDLKQGIDKMAGKGAFPIKNTFFKREGLGLIQGFLKTDELLDFARKQNCSITVLAAAISMLAVTKIYYKDTHKQDLIVFIPINLRRFYPTKSVYNFTTFAKCHINPNTVNHDLQSYIAVIKEQLNKQLEKEELDLKMSFTSLLDVKPYLKYMPLFLKSFFAKLGRRFTGASKQTMIISNLGRVEMPQRSHEFIKNFTFMLNCSRKTPNNMAIISFGNTTAISFTRQIVSTEIEKEFFSMLAQAGLKVEIISNLREV